MRTKSLDDNVIFNLSRSPRKEHTQLFSSSRGEKLEGNQIQPMAPPFLFVFSAQIAVREREGTSSPHRTPNCVCKWVSNCLPGPLFLSTHTNTYYSQMQRKQEQLFLPKSLLCLRVYTMCACLLSLIYCMFLSRHRIRFGEREEIVLAPPSLFLCSLRLHLRLNSYSLSCAYRDKHTDRA